ncbi:MAG: hypothetical protein IJH40_08855 [Ruminococcus sp.]|uniref:dockerin type I domain-containing protein n=1 Tax=Ruminococcus sp. TaxID=41978 RepID=UPI002872B9A1|nr:dockerin type I domain-containing protein [Ruminococcus sp.]MBQ3285732.1 hypothetical protein [Ruminococcus sp.]
MKRVSIKIISVFFALLLCLTVVFSAALPVMAATVYLRGTFNGWENPPEYAMTYENGRYMITIHLDKGSYEYKAATADWTTFQAPVEGNESLTLDQAADVTFIAYTDSNIIEAYSHSSLEADVNKVVLRSKWQEHSDLVLTEKNSAVSYQSVSKSYPATAYWNIISDGDGAYYLQNDSTKHYAALSGSALTCVSTADGGDTSWYVDTTMGVRFISTANENAIINIEALSGNAQATSVPMYYTSSQWEFEYSSYDYRLTTDKVIDTGYNAYADSPTSITSYMTGSRKTWTQSKNLSAYPAFSAPNTPLAAAVYNLSLEEAVKSIHTDSYGQVFYTGTAWQKVWTRDTALSNLYSLAWVFPEISYNCEREKIKTSGGVSVFEQDTGTGGSYPVSTDKIITMLSVWETYLADGNTDHLSYFYDVCSNTIMQDMNVAYDTDAGLFRGETCGLDWRDQTYPDWTSETYDSGLSAIAESKTASVNAIYCRVLEIMSQSARVLGKGADAEQAWAKMASDLEAKISSRLWNENMGLYSSWEYPEYMGSVKAEKTDVLGNGFALWFDIGSDSQMTQICENSPLVPYGADTVYPQKQGKLKNADKIYHNFGIWPGWDSTLMVGASYHGNKAVAEEIFNSNVRGAAVSLTNKEVINYRTGEGVESDQQLWSIAGTLAGYYRVMFGMNYDEDGITFDPYIPDWMEGPFNLSNYKYRNATLSINLSGEGDQVKSFKVDGVAKDIDTYVFPVNATGNHTIDIEMQSGDTEYTMNKSEDNLVVCPEMPILTYAGGRLIWSAMSGLTYKMWTGKEYVDVSGGTYTPDTSVYGCYSLMAISADGVCSELSKPIVISPDRIKVEAESGSVSSSSLISNGYVTDNRSRSANLTLSVTIPKSGKYELSGIYNNPGDATSGVSCAIRSVYVDGEDKGSLVFPEVSSDKTNQTSTHLTLDLTEGVHTVKVFYDTANWYDRNMSITNNNVKYNYFNFDYVGTGAPEPTEPPTEPAPTEPAPTEPPTEPAKGILGDVDGDGDVNIIDATYIQRYLAGITISFDFKDIVADVDEDGDVNIIDVTMLQRWLAGIITSDKIGLPIV